MLKDFFTSACFDSPAVYPHKAGYIGQRIRTNKGKFPSLKDVQIALIGVGNNANKIRKYFYELADRFAGLEIADLGNIKNDKDQVNLEFGLGEAIYELNKLQIATLVIGEHEDLLLGLYHPYRQSNKGLDMALVSPNIFGQKGEGLQRLLKIKNSNLFHLSFLAQQSYLVRHEDFEETDHLFTDFLRLGELRQNPHDMEPLLREAHSFHFNLSSLKAEAFASSSDKYPNGLYTEEACQICRYAGISNNVACAAFTGFNLNKNNITDAMQVAQMIWYFIEGFYGRYNDHPSLDDRNFMVYRCHLAANSQELVFVKSKITDRWWMQIPYGKKHCFVGCTQSDFDLASEGEIPEKWFRAMKKLF